MYDKKGAILGIVLIYMLALTILGYGFLELSCRNAIQTNKSVSSNQAFWLADAGLTQVLYKLINDTPTGYRTNPTNYSGYGSIIDADNTYSITVDATSDPYVFTSRGTVHGINRSIAYSIPRAFFYPLYYGKNLIVPGAEITYVNGEPEYGTTFPEVDFAYYQNIASPGQDISGNYRFTAGTYSGIWYIDGNVTIEDNVTINGSLITTRSLSCGNNLSINATLPYPALIVNSNFNLNMNTGINIRGFVYIGVDGNGNFTSQKDAECNFTGTVIVNGNVQLQSGTSITFTYDPTLIPGPPPGLSFSEEDIYWHEVPSN